MSADRWILLRGLFRHSGHWGRFARRFADTMQIDTKAIVSLDMPGNGVLSDLDSPLTISRTVDQLRSQVRQRTDTRDRPLHLIGLSMGGMMALDWSASFPREVRSTVLINTSAKPYSHWYQRFRPSHWWRLLQIVGGGAALQERRIVEMVVNSQSTREHTYVEWLRLAEEAGYVNKFNALRQLAAAASYCAPSRLHGQKMFVVASHGDRMVDVGCSIRLAAALSLPICIHPSAGHDIPREDTLWLCRQIRAWYQREGIAVG